MDEGDRVQVSYNSLLTEYHGEIGTIIEVKGYDCFCIQLDSGPEIMLFGPHLEKVV